MIEFKRREKIIAAVIGGVICIFLFEKFFFSGVRGRAKNIHQKIRLEEANLKINVQLEKDKDKIIKECDAYKSYFQVEPDTPDRQVVGMFLKELEKMAQEAGLSIGSLNPQIESEMVENRKKYKAEMRAEANSEQLCNFLYKVQSSKLLMKINKLSVSPKDEEATALKLEMAIIMVLP